MDNRYPYTSSDEERARRRAQRIAARKRRERARRMKMLRRMVPLMAVACLAVILLGVLAVRRAAGGGSDTPDGFAKAAASFREPLHIPKELEVTDPPVFAAVTTGDTVQIPADEIVSGYAVVVDVEKGAILAEKDAFTAVSPASMTKILTVLVAAEQITDLDATCTITQDITDYTFGNGCSVAGFALNEAVPVRDLFYGTILPSGADAALALALHVAGTHEAFVDLMNEKAAELGCSQDTHFANCVGVYDEANVCSVYDMALILKAAMDNELCRQVLTTRTWEIPPNDFHPEGIVLNNWFIRRIEDHMSPGVEVLGAKTGYVSQAGSCAASYARDKDGRFYLCVTAKAGSSWSAIYDHAALYEKYVGAQSAAPEG